MSDPQFTFVSTNPFGLNDVGLSSSPTFVDIDNDGDLDAFIGEHGGDTLFFRNTGTAGSPAFAAASTNPFGLSNVGVYASPTFADIDNDGDQDALVGDGYNLYFFRNTGTASNPAFAAASANPFGLSTGGGTIAKPDLVDIDADGDLDVFVGKLYGNTLFFRNTGTASNPAFAAASTNPFGLSDVGYSSAPVFVDIDGDGDQDAIIGNDAGNLLLFRNTGTASSPAFAADSTNPFGLGNVGSFAKPAFADIDADGDLDGFFGNFAGNTLFFENLLVDTPLDVFLWSTAGNDILTGTASLNDTVSYENATAAVTVSLAITSQQDTIGAGLDIITAIENLIGSNYSDVLTGDSQNNRLEGRAGKDTLNGGVGADNMTGGLGNDIYFVDNAGDVVTENSAEGSDKISSTVTYTLPAHVEYLSLTGTAAINGSGNDLANLLIGNSAANQLIGAAGNDTLNGQAGADTMIGGLGNDEYVVGSAGDTIIENPTEGTDNVRSYVTYTLPDNVENLTLAGSSAINGTGNSQINRIIGNSGNNQLSGGGGNDTLDGKAGTDTLSGGAGNDKFNFTTAGHSDTIADFIAADDTIQLDNAVFTSLAAGTLAVSQFRMGANALDADDFVIYNNTSGAILYDADGSGAGAAVQIAIVGTGLSLTSADFVVI